MRRCAWVNLDNPRYIRYHDEEWGREQHDDRILFEMLVLETFQAGLSWECILNKRDAFRDAYEGFDPDRVMRFDDAKVDGMLLDEGIIRHRGKIEASIRNAMVFRRIQDEFGSFDSYIWGFTDGTVVEEEYPIRTTSPLSDRVSADLRRRGMRFLGSTTVYAYLQSIGIIYGHGPECCLPRHERQSG